MEWTSHRDLAVMVAPLALRTQSKTFDLAELAGIHRLCGNKHSLATLVAPVTSLVINPGEVVITTADTTIKYKVWLDPTNKVHVV